MHQQVGGTQAIQAVYKKSFNSRKVAFKAMFESSWQLFYPYVARVADKPLV
jgi:hypothetical protein